MLSTKLKKNTEDIHRQAEKVMGRCRIIAGILALGRVDILNF